MKKHLLLSTLALSPIISPLLAQLTPPTTLQMLQPKQSCINQIIAHPSTLTDDELDCRLCASGCCAAGGVCASGTTLVAYAAASGCCVSSSPSLVLTGLLTGTFGPLLFVLTPALAYHFYYFEEKLNRKSKLKQERKQAKKDHLNKLNQTVDILAKENERLLQQLPQSTALKSYNYTQCQEGSIQTTSIK